MSEIDIYGACELLGIDPLDYAEIVGADRRSAGGWGSGLQQNMVGAGAQRVLQRLAGQPAQLLQDKAALARPAVRGIPLTRRKETVISCNVYGTAGATFNATGTPLVRFRPERLVAIELTNGGTTNNPAQNQILTGAFIGAENALPYIGSAATGIHLGSSPANGQGIAITWPTAQPNTPVILQVYFIATGTLYASLYGTSLS